MVLNANALQNAWQESRTACLHFDKNPLRHVPVPRYDAGNAAHAELAKLGAAAENTGDGLRDVAAQVDELVNDLLPEYCIREGRRSGKSSRIENWR